MSVKFTERVLLVLCLREDDQCDHYKCSKYLHSGNLGVFPRSGPFSKKKSRRENSPSSFGMLLVAEAAEALISLFTKGNLHYAHFLLQTEVFDAVLESDHKFINRDTLYNF